MATIEIRSRDVEVFGVFGAQHLFIIFTNGNGARTIVRGGPENGHEFTDNLHIIKSPYEDQFKHLFPGDYVRGNPSSIVFTGSDIDMQTHIDHIWAKAVEINLEHYDYKLPVPGCPSDLCHVQNSNTVVKVMIEAADLQFQLPVVDGKEIWAQGINGDLKHTIIDEGVKALHKTLDVWGTFNDLEVRNPNLDNSQRFKLLAQKAKDAGDARYEEVYTKLAIQQDLFMSLFGEVEDKPQANHLNDYIDNL